VLRFFASGFTIDMPLSRDYVARQRRCHDITRRDITPQMLRAMMMFYDITLPPWHSAADTP